MKKLVIAFDVDGTLIRNDGPGDMDGGVPVANERIRSLLIALASFKNTKIVVWSGGGELYARQIASRIGIDKYVDEFASKNYVDTEVSSDGKKNHIFKPDIRPDIAIDDIHACELGRLNLIVSEK